jgi:hypothetical protein
MRRVISISAWVSVMVTILCLILTMLSSYGYIKLSYFSNYYMFQITIIATMFLWSIKQFHIKRGEWINSVLCMCMGFGTMIFMFMGIY